MLFVSEKKISSFVCWGRSLTNYPSMSWCFGVLLECFGQKVEYILLATLGYDTIAPFTWCKHAYKYFVVHSIYLLPALTSKTCHGTHPSVSPIDRYRSIHRARFGKCKK